MINPIYSIDQADATYRFRIHLTCRVIKRPYTSTFVIITRLNWIYWLNFGEKGAASAHFVLSERRDHINVLATGASWCFAHVGLFPPPSSAGAAAWPRTQCRSISLRARARIEALQATVRSSRSGAGIRSSTMCLLSRLASPCPYSNCEAEEPHWHSIRTCPWTRHA